MDTTRCRRGRDRTRPPVTPTDVLREAVFPFRDLAVVQAMFWFWILGMLVDAAGLFGLWLAIAIVPAFFRYALHLLDARAEGRTAPPPGIELFNLVGNFWSLFPLVLIAALTWAIVAIGWNVSLVAAALTAVALLFVLPASMAVLAITRSPLQSLNPASWARMVGACGQDYLWVPLVILLATISIGWLAYAGLPLFVLEFLSIYVFYLMFTLTGAVVGAQGVARLVDIPDAVEPGADVVEEQLTAERKRVANHAYGFISRGNRAGGFAHIEEWLREEGDGEEAWQWFFEELLRWDSTTPALFFAQDYLRLLLDRRHDAQAIKLLARCLHVEPRFRPHEADRDAVTELLERANRDDLKKQLEQ